MKIIKYKKKKKIQKKKIIFKEMREFFVWEEMTLEIWDLEIQTKEHLSLF